MDRDTLQWFSGARRGSNAGDLRRVIPSPPQILAACREDPAQLKSTVAMLHAAFQQVNPQLPGCLCSPLDGALHMLHLAFSCCLPASAAGLNCVSTALGEAPAVVLLSMLRPRPCSAGWQV